MNDREQLRLFQLEAQEHLQSLEACALALERDRQDLDQVRQAFQHVHAIKGASGYVGLVSVGRLSHAMEELLKQVRAGELEVTGRIIDVFLSGVDLLRSCCENLEEPEHAAEDVDRLVSLLEERAAGEDQPAPAEAAREARDEAEDDSGLLAAFAEAAGQHLDALQRGAQRLRDDDDPSGGLQIVQRAAGVFAASARYVGAGAVAEELEGLREAALAGEGEQAGLPALVGQATERIAELLGALDAPAEAPAEEGPARPAGAQEARAMTGDAATLRVSMASLDRFVNLVSDLIVVRNSLGHAVEAAELDGWTEGGGRVDVVTAARQLDKLTAALQAQSMAVRLVPVRSLLVHFQRVVRDLARAADKDMVLALVGADTEVDKSLFELLRDPLLHLVRNAVAHGIESPEERRAAGKAARGQITIRAEKEGSHLAVAVTDDGRGLDPERVAAAALRNGEATRAELDRMSAREVVDLIFRPGVTTGETADGISGRGVGLDAVLSGVKQVGGSVRVDWEPGQGTSFRLTLPLSLATVDAALVRAAGQRFAIPTTYLEGSLRVAPEQVSMVGSTRAIVHRGEPLPLRSLAELVEGSPAELADAGDAGAMTVLLLGLGSRQLALAVDALEGQQELLARPLSPELRRLSRYSGASLMGDGSLVLIIDPPWLFARREQQ